MTSTQTGAPAVILPPRSWFYICSVPVPAAHRRRRDGSGGNYPLSQCVRYYKQKQGFPSGSSAAQVSEQLMAFRSEWMKETAVVCSQSHTTFVLLFAVRLNLPAILFTPQGDHVIRSPPLDHLSFCSTAPPEEDCSSWRKGNNTNRQEATASNVHHWLDRSLSFCHQESHHFIMLFTRFFFFFYNPIQVRVFIFVYSPIPSITVRKNT